MSVKAWTAALVLGGIRSGKSEFAESLVTAAASRGDGITVRYVATAAVTGDDPSWSARIEAHQRRRPAGWTVEELSGPDDLMYALGSADPGEVVLVDDLGGWVARLLDLDSAAQAQRIEALATSVAACRARLVLVSSEVGLGLVPTTEVGAAYADLLGITNRAVARACADVALIVAGQPTWLKGSVATESTLGHPHGVAVPAGEEPAPVAPTTPTPHRGADASTTTGSEGSAALSESTMALPMVTTGLVIQSGMELPMPSEDAERDVLARLATVDLPGAGFGALTSVLRFAARTQGTATPGPWRSIRFLLVRGDVEGGAAAGTDFADAAHRADQARAGEGPIGVLAGRAGVSLRVIEAAAAGPIDAASASHPEIIEAALRQGWRLAEEAVDSGADLLVLGSCGAGAETAAAAIVSAVTGAEIAGLLGRRVGPDGRVDDEAWMRRCLTARDAIRRTKTTDSDARMLLTELGGAGMAIMVGILLGATARRTAIMIDGPVGVAAGLVARDLAGQTRHWCLLPDHGGDPAAKLGADVLGLDPIMELRLGLGEGASVLAALPVMQSALSLAGALWGVSAPASAPYDSLAADPVPRTAAWGDEQDTAGWESAQDGVAAPGGPGFATPTGAHPVVEPGA